MPNRCDVLQKKPTSGNRVSHSNQHTKRVFRVNAHKRRFWVESEGKWVVLWVSTKGLRTIDKRGIDNVLKEIRSRGQKV